MIGSSTGDHPHDLFILNLYNNRMSHALNNVYCIFSLRLFMSPLLCDICFPQVTLQLKRLVSLSNYTARVEGRQQVGGWDG